jgi:hypothetical protein
VRPADLGAGWWWVGFSRPCDGFSIPPVTRVLAEGEPGRGRERAGTKDSTTLVVAPPADLFSGSRS